MERIFGSIILITIVLAFLAVAFYWINSFDQPTEESVDVDVKSETKS